jgi:hypothetical protein
MHLYIKGLCNSLIDKKEAMTMTNERSAALGVFADNEQADKAIDDLRHAGFGYNQIRVVAHGTGGFLDSFKSLFTSQETVNANTPDDLIKLGVPEQDARYYQSQLDAGHVIVAVNAIDRLEQALSILHQDGAHDISARLRTAEADLTNNAPQSANMTPQSVSEAPQSAPGMSQPPVETQQFAGARSGSYSPNAPQSPYDQNVPPVDPRVSETPHQE